MGRKLSASEETELLRQVTREAHEATQALRAAIRDARALAPQLVSEFEAVHTREIQQLSNYFTEESNRCSADLNAHVERAREMINDQIMAGKAVFDRNTSTVTISWGPGAFDAQVPIPYPQVAQKETQQ